MVVSQNLGHVIIIQRKIYSSYKNMFGGNFPNKYRLLGCVIYMFYSSDMGMNVKDYENDTVY